MRQLFRYFGSKARMVRTITSMIPPDTEGLVSLFVGSGVFEYNYAMDHPQCRVICYDIDPVLVNFHQCALKHRAALHGSILSLHKKLCGGEPAVLGKDAFDRLLATHRAAKSTGGVDGAARFCVLTAYSFNGKFGSYAAKDKFLLPAALLNALPKNIEVQVGDAMQVLRSLTRSTARQKVCLYLDPPYMYSHEVPDYYTTSTKKFDHIEMASLLRSVHSRGMRWLLSYNDTPVVRSLYRGHTMLSLPIKYTYYNRRHSPPHTHLVTRKAELLVTDQEVTPSHRRHTRALFMQDQQHAHLGR